MYMNIGINLLYQYVYKYNVYRAIKIGLQSAAQGRERLKYIARYTSSEKEQFLSVLTGYCRLLMIYMLRC